MISSDGYNVHLEGVTREMIMDNGSKFGAHRRGDNKEWDSRFRQHVKSLGIMLIYTILRSEIFKYKKRFKKC